ncbi:hypothetical protein CFE70_002278 [Pyrenophora teres f. teres 0-1]|uniref:Uncharacterized protein n=2 Tax=Pyrenophora teres f. teres TaxID=97479 RepID=E3RSY3_PYRTT|nr:hypothetical protein PTT_12076 [Pyrenophora teres f. teres 0-1]KAE8842848.1 hypothetical protein HRS9139_02145 [Pyrenophora teres f. teres]CAA9958765.1 hypothetical protein PTMSG1_02303 [Pyrenophora teres f. maculata]KAE8850097.1 hypothetical protein PTNB85_00513 [Pyrenophora teres f. teres]KAE8851878.1 hypothetical protein HRS9122_02165 [Pyrenophora teres f. teres]
MQIPAIVLLFVATVSASSCYNEFEKFLPSKGELLEGNTKNIHWSYCPYKNGCCSDNTVFYGCKNFCKAGSSCTIANGQTTC